MSIDMWHPICWNCGVQMGVEKNGVIIAEMTAFGPCALWMADLWKCEQCGFQTVVTAKAPYSRSEFRLFKTELELAKASGFYKEVWINLHEKSRHGE